MTESFVGTETRIPEDNSRIVTQNSNNNRFDINQILALLQKDAVVLIPGVNAEDVDGLIGEVSEKLGLKDTLELQATFASSLGHRKNISKYYMSVNERTDYHIVPPHSEGSSFANIQLASFYCYENTTDGGETILMNVDDSSNVWDSLREHVIRGKFIRTPTAADIYKARALYRLNLLEDTLRKDDVILNEGKVDPELTLYEVLAKPKRIYSCILKQKRYAFWDSICAVDYDALHFMERLLRQEGLFKEPPNYKRVEQLDWDPGRRTTRTGAKYEELFKCKVTRKLNPGDLIIQNNFTWTHSVNNWSPDLGVRKVAAAFA